MNTNNFTIYIVDDEKEICEALRCLFESVKFNVETYENASLFLDKFNSNRQGCLILDVRLPGMSGLELLEHLKEKKIFIPTIVITGHGDIQMAVRAMKMGAKEFILKPLNEQCILETVQHLINQSQNASWFIEINKRLNKLSQREHQIIDLIINGKLNKEIAYELNISISTVEAHRANIMQKMQAKNLAQLVKIYLEANFNNDSLNTV